MIRDWINYNMRYIIIIVFTICTIFPFDGSNIYNESWALIIGINEYDNVSPLNYAANDANSMKDLLISDYNFSEENIRLITNKEATKQNILSGFNDILLNADEDDRVLIFYAGHGETFTLPKGGDKGYLLPVDGSPDNLFLTAIPMKTIYEIAEMSYAKHILYLVDACYGGLSISTRGLSKTSNEDIYLQKITRENGRQIITAGGKEEKVIEKASWGHSAFTRNLLKGLGEKLADTDNDNIITATELGDFLKKRVTADSEGAHTPQTGRIGSEEGEFVFLDAAYSSNNNSSDISVSQDISWYSNEISSLKNELETLKMRSSNINNSIELYKPDKPILIILPYESEYHEVPKSIQRKLTDVITSSIGAIKRFRVVDRNNIQQIVKEKKFQKSGLINLDENEINEIGSILASKEAIQIKGINFGQIGVASDVSHASSYHESEELKLARIKYGVERSHGVDTLSYYNNIRTNLLAEVRKINIDTGEILDSKTFEVVYEGGIRSESLGKALVKLQSKVSDWIKKKFSLESTIIQVNAKDIVVLSGEDLGVEEGAIYHIQEIEKEREINGQKISIAGKDIGFAKVYKVGKNSSNAKIIKSWGEIKEGQKLAQFNDFILNMDWLFNSTISENNHIDYAIGFKTQLTQKPRLIRREWMMTLGLVPNENGDYFFNFQFSPIFKLDYESPSSISFYPNIKIPFNWTMGKDDLGLSARNILINPHIGIDINIPRGNGQDYVIQLGYHLMHIDTKWKSKSCDDEEKCTNIDSYWLDPQGANIDKKTFFISLGIKNWNINNKFW